MKTSYFAGQRPIRGGSLVIVNLGVLWGLAGCDSLYGAFTIPNQDSCTQNSAVCTAEQICEVRTGRCISASADMSLPSDAATLRPTPCVGDDVWCALDPQPQSSTLKVVWGADASNAWAVGDNGVIL